MKIQKLSLMFFLFCLVAFCSATIYAESMVDHLGRKVEIPVSTGRVISFSPGITEMVYSLGQGDRLVGATIYSTVPEDAKRLPRVGSYVRLDLEKILALKPDLCISTADGNQKHIVDRLDALGVPVVVAYPKNLQGIQDTLILLGAALGVSKKAETQVQNIQKRLHRIREKVKIIKNRPRVFYQVDTPLIVSVGTHTFLHELITLAGGENVSSGSRSYPRYSWEDILVLKPEVVLISSMAGGLTPNELIRKWRRWHQIPAVKNNRIYVLNGDMFNRPTARLLNGLEEMTKKIHPELF